MNPRTLPTVGHLLKSPSGSSEKADPLPSTLLQLFEESDAPPNAENADDKSLSSEDHGNGESETNTDTNTEPAPRTPWLRGKWSLSEDAQR